MPAWPAEILELDTRFAGADYEAKETRSWGDDELVSVRSGVLKR